MKSFHTTPPVDVKYMPWQLVCKYVQILRDRTEPLLDRYCEQSIVDYLVLTEEAIRGRAIELARSSESPWAFGQALDEAAKQHAQDWNDNKERLRPLRMERPQLREAALPKRARDPAVANIQPEPASKHAESSQGKRQTMSHNGAGLKICKAYNDSRGCSQKCPKGEKHSCDITLMKTHKACDGSHPRLEHNEQTHGKQLLS